ncbi:MAG: hypothetical protein IIZ55_09520 [Firmicutes bacterium]|nr:hypothetical protein [Bacillota bacterium]
MKKVGFSVILLGIVYFISQTFGAIARAAEEGTAATLSLTQLPFEAYEGLMVAAIGVCIRLLAGIRADMEKKDDALHRAGARSRLASKRIRKLAPVHGPKARIK